MAECWNTSFFNSDFYFAFSASCGQMLKLHKIISEPKKSAHLPILTESKQDVSVLYNTEYMSLEMSCTFNVVFLFFFYNHSICCNAIQALLVYANMLFRLAVELLNIKWILSSVKPETDSRPRLWHYLSKVEGVHHTGSVAPSNYPELHGVLKTACLNMLQ